MKAVIKEFGLKLTEEQLSQVEEQVKGLGNTHKIAFDVFRVSGIIKVRVINKEFGDSLAGLVRFAKENCK